MTDNDLLPLLEQRLLGLYHPLLADTVATILFSAGGLANWTVEVERGRARARRGRPSHPTTTVRAPLSVLTEVASGSRSGVQAFLDGDLTVRGNLALALELDGLFPGEDDDDTRTYTRSVRAAGMETFFLESGPVDAPPIVLVHGLSATNASMLPLIPALSKDYHVLAPDLPGHGGTEARSGAHGAPYLGDWLVDFLRTTCGDEPAVLIGNSLGGRTSLEAALLQPDLVRGLVLLCPAVAFRRLRQLVPFVRIVPDEIARLPVRIPRRVAMRGLRQLFADPARIPEPWLDAAMDEFIRVISIRANRLCTFSALRHIYLDEPFGETGFWERLPGLVPPALFVWGDRDVLVPAGFARFVAEALPSAESVILPDCGHVPQFEYRERTADLTRDFLATLT
ncbi:Pimeloyl-ACP methyl ester carboxylesterase [Jatrophihabitans endophyticus]|uniref:Pimeloyl-ACP methyl ester carboxylesterase n=1 Tax=Jatrophihabitans endophyticus TaxID=1206085 RepID=A0A1M5DGX4_9ACTN|nr:alpha/beta fold hydrolase [Jatrophihabitans endophyticus]SHF66131.1 Pimeloyl-ACP methyl ester carboxylesterase [Jatrophihabitans endophyticus]